MQHATDALPYSREASLSKLSTCAALARLAALARQRCPHTTCACARAPQATMAIRPYLRGVGLRLGWLLDGTCGWFRPRLPQNSAPRNGKCRVGWPSMSCADVGPTPHTHTKARAESGCACNNSMHLPPTEPNALLTTRECGRQASCRRPKHRHLVGGPRRHSLRSTCAECGSSVIVWLRHEMMIEA